MMKLLPKLPKRKVKPKEPVAAAAADEAAGPSLPLVPPAALEVETPEVEVSPEALTPAPAALEVEEGEAKVGRKELPMVPEGEEKVEDDPLREWSAVALHIDVKQLLETEVRRSSLFIGFVTFKNSEP
jgi:hypothetical protein